MKKSSRKSSKTSSKTKSSKLSSKKDYSRKGYYAQFGIDVNDKKSVKKHLDEQLRIIQKRTKKLQGGIKTRTGSGPGGQSLQSQKDDLRNELLKIKSRQESDKNKAKECAEFLVKQIAENFEIISMSEEKLHGKFNANNGKKWDVLLTRDNSESKTRKNPITKTCPYCHAKLMFGTNMCRNCGPI